MKEEKLIAIPQSVVNRAAYHFDLATKLRNDTGDFILNICYETHKGEESWGCYDGDSDTNRRNVAASYSSNGLKLRRNVNLCVRDCMAKQVHMLNVTFTSDFSFIDSEND